MVRHYRSNRSFPLRGHPFQDDKRLHDYNVPERVEGFLRAVYVQVRPYTPLDCKASSIDCIGSDLRHQSYHHHHGR